MFLSSVCRVLLLIQTEGLPCGFISVYCYMSTNRWLPPSVCAVTGGGVQDFPSFLKDAGEQLERNPARSLWFLASQTLSAQTCAKLKQTPPRLLITIRLDLCPVFSLRLTQNGCSPPLKKIGERSCRRSLSPGDNPLSPVWCRVTRCGALVIFQTYYFMCKVINYTTDTRLVSSGPCGLNRRQILRR